MTFQDAAPSKEVRPLEGISGWLVLMAIGQVLGPLQVFTGMLNEYTSLPDGTIARYPLAFAGDLILRVTFIGLLIYTAVHFFSKRASFPRLFIISYVASLCIPFLIGLWVTFTSGVNTIGNLFTGSDLGAYSFGAVTGAIWVAYVINSVRVKNTFVR
jgi:hypothetical protein